MRRVIYSLYIDIQKPVSHFENQKKFNDNYSWLLERQQQYADICGVVYKHFTYDDDFVEYSKLFDSDISEYDIMIWMLYQLQSLIFLTSGICQKVLQLCLKNGLTKIQIDNIIL